MEYELLIIFILILILVFIWIFIFFVSNSKNEEPIIIDSVYCNTCNQLINSSRYCYHCITWKTKSVIDNNFIVNTIRCYWKDKTFHLIKDFLDQNDNSLNYIKCDGNYGLS